MFEIRDRLQEIYVMHVGSLPNIPSDNEIKNGDSAILKYKQYRVEINSITILTKSSYSGIIGTCADTNTERKVIEINDELNLRVGSTVQFFKDNVFACARMS